MQYLFRGCGLLLGLILVLPLLAADDKKPSRKDKDDKTKHVDSDTLATGPYTGKLLALPDSDRTVSMTVDEAHLTPKNANTASKTAQAVAKQEAHVAQLEADLAAAKNPKDYAHKTQQLEAALAKLQQEIQKAAADVKVVTNHNTVDFQLAPDVKIRMISLPTQFDSEGNVKKYTDEEKKALKGADTNLPGYQAKLEDLQVGNLVRVTLWRKPAPKKTDDDKSAGDKDSKDADADKDAGEKKSQVTMIVILNDATDSTDKDKPKDKGTPPKKQ
jgi:hypothetical protein